MGHLEKYKNNIDFIIFFLNFKRIFSLVEVKKEERGKRIMKTAKKKPIPGISSGYLDFLNYLMPI